MLENAHQNSTFTSKTSEQKTSIEYIALNRLSKKLNSYCKRLPVLGFNSANYDLNLVKACFLKHLNLTPKNGDYVIKRSNAYLCIATEQFKFLDITSYLAAGASYSKFLKAYGVKEEKGFFLTNGLIVKRKSITPIFLLTKISFQI